LPVWPGASPHPRARCHPDFSEGPRPRKATPERGVRSPLGPVAPAPGIAPAGVGVPTHGRTSYGLPAFFVFSRDLDPWVGFLVEAQLVAPGRRPEIHLLNRAPVRHDRTCDNHSGKGVKKAYGEWERNACGGGHRCTPGIRQWTKTKLTLCLRVSCEGPHTDGKIFLRVQGALSRRAPGFSRWSIGAGR